MSPDERARQIEEAIARIEPLDDAHREWLARKPARFREIAESSNRELAALLEESVRERSERRAEIEAMRRDTQESLDRFRVFRDTFASAFDEHTDLIDLIVGSGE